MRIGIQRIGVYAGLARIDVLSLLEGRGLDVSRAPNIDMVERSVGLSFEDPVTNAVHAAQPILQDLSAEEKARIELLVVSTESGVDFSKSVASYIHRILGLSPHCRILEVKQACFAATGALQLAVGLLASGLSGAATALVIGTDVALVDAKAQYAEPATGHGAVALLVSDQPDILEIDLGAYGTYAFETLDSARPTATFDIADSDQSLFAYLDCLEKSFVDYQSRVPDADPTSFDRLAMHTPFAGLVRAGHRMLMAGVGHQAEAIQADFDQRLEASLHYPRRAGNLCSGSLYLALASLIDNTDSSAPFRVGLYSYGSGCCAEFFSGVVGPQARHAMASANVARQLSDRRLLTFEEYDALLPATEQVLVPIENREVPRDAVALVSEQIRARGRHLIWTGTRQYHRTYAWINAAGEETEG